MNFIASEKILWKSPDPQGLYCYSPFLAEGFDNRLILSFDISGPGLSAVSGPKSDSGDFNGNQCRIFVSDDRGENWRETARLPMLHARVFKGGDSLWLIGHSGRLLISQSTDNGESWSEPAVLDDEYFWHQAPCSMDFRRGRIYLTMEHAPLRDKGWAGGDPVLMSADLTADLTKRASWTFSNCMKFKEDIPHEKNLFCFTPGVWLESNVVRIYDPDHRFYDPQDRTVLLFSRCAVDVDNGNIAAVLKGTEADDGSLKLELLTMNDFPLLYIPFPGGCMKFHIVYDEVSRLYWLIASRNESSNFLQNPKRYPGVGMERRQLELFYSRDLFDWCSAGMVAAGDCLTASRHYASLLIDGEDLLVASRSGDENGKNPHDTNLITLHRIKSFRNLA